LPSMDQFSIIDKNEGMCCVEIQNKYCLQCIAVFSITTPNFVNVLNDNCSEKNLFNSATGPLTAVGCREWTTQFPSMDHTLNIGKCTFIRAVAYYSLQNCILC